MALSIVKACCIFYKTVPGLIFASVGHCRWGFSMELLLWDCWVVILYGCSLLERKGRYSFLVYEYYWDDRWVMDNQTDVKSKLLL